MIRCLFGLHYLLLCMVLCSCGGKAKIIKTEKQQIFESLLANEHQELKDGYYMIIPVQGCEHCMPQAMAFSKGFLNDNRISFILTVQNGMKEIEKNYSKEELRSSNIINDNNGDFIRNKFASTWLTLIKVENGVMWDKEIVTPEKVPQRLKELEAELLAIKG